MIHKYLLQLCYYSLGWLIGQILESLFLKDGNTKCAMYNNDIQVNILIKEAKNWTEE